MNRFPISSVFTIIPPDLEEEDNYIGQPRSKRRDMDVVDRWGILISEVNILVSDPKSCCRTTSMDRRG